MADIQELQRIASQVRRDIIRQVFLCQSGHPGGSLGNADLFVALYFDIMKHDPSFNMEGKGEDVFFLSNGHISPVWYSTLARAGYFPVEELNTFRAIDSRLQGHPTTHEGLPGVRIASGSLGQGMSVACGMALAKKMDGDDRTVFVLTGDGEQQEGQNWEAALFAPHHKLDNLVVIIDDNGQQIDGPTSEVMYMGDLGKKYASFGWEIVDMDGNNMAEVVETLRKVQGQRNGKPTCIIMKTAMGKGVDYMEGTHKWHGKAPDEELALKALAQLEETLGDFPAEGI
ncbi:transketolase [Lewinella sp. W8]|uniref:transketolase n=1 Tax=Lewinella sp. W8 TaxID=2528208 RepID=UPI0010676A2E|nr:transketolase [Lewinella sp. W8]MTB52737.1 transketolase [Lewinella sp. W8]